MNVFGLFAKTLENLLFLQKAVIGQSSSKRSSLSVRTVTHNIVTDNNVIVEYRESKLCMRLISAPFFVTSLSFKICSIYLKWLCLSFCVLTKLCLFVVYKSVFLCWLFTHLDIKIIFYSDFYYLFFSKMHFSSCTWIKLL